LIAPRLRGLASTLVFPLAWVGVEFIESRLSPGATWGLSGYTQFGNQPLLQTASVTGTFGITFLIGWFASVVNLAWDRRFVWREIQSAVLLYAAVFILVILSGSARIAAADSPARMVRAAVVSYPREMFRPGEATHIRFGQVNAEEREPFRRKMSLLQDWFLENSDREARAGAKLILWPELNLLVFKEDEPAFIERAKELARRDTTYLLIGMASVTLGATRPLENKAVLINDSGRIVCSYVKGHPMTGGEETYGTPGDGRPFVGRTAFGRTAIAICFDMDFPGFIREAGEEHAELLLVPANDWAEIKHVHTWMAGFRAVENGATMIRATSTGLSTVVDPYGRTLALTDHFSPGARVMVAQVPLASTGTIYSRVGDLFSWLCLACLAILAAWGAVRPVS
jgi:apolipoprotein N-acyltransferase